MTPVVEMAWPLSRLGEAMEVLASRSALSPRRVETPVVPRDLEGPESIGKWIESAALHLGIEAEPTEVTYAETENLVARSGPALVRVPAPEGPRFLAILDGGPRGSRILTPEFDLIAVPVGRIRKEICRDLEEPLRAPVDRILAEAGVPEGRRGKASDVIIRQRLSQARIGGCWLLRLSPSAPLWRQARHHRLLRWIFVFLSAHTAQYFLWLLSWSMIGKGALEGRLDRGWLIAWTLLLVTLVPFRMFVTWAQGRFAIGLGGLFKQRLLSGTLRLHPEETRHQGAGQLLGRVIESEAVESMALSAGFLGMTALVELAIAGGVLALGSGGGIHAALLLVWIGLTLGLSWRYLRDRRRWTENRIGLTNDLVERLVGHRTRLAQEPRERWHRGEDQALHHYHELSQRMDRSAILVEALVSRGWLVAGMAGLVPAILTGRASLGAVAVGLGGVILAYQALAKLAGGLTHLAGAWIAWRQVAPLFRAADRSEEPGSPTFALLPDGASQGNLLSVHEVVFRYRERGEPVLRRCDLRIRAGDRLLLEGPSGGGKSTLASLLIGLRTPESGLILLRGLDRQTLGAGVWRSRIVSAPQFHENHVLTETFAFNLLMGRRWPAREEDLAEAERVCRELGLGELLERMPSGLLQMVGDTGWQLSHGERSRLFIARALLQGSDLIVLDESFAALDPENLRRALRCVLARAKTVLVIAHP